MLKQRYKNFYRLASVNISSTSLEQIDRYIFNPTKPHQGKNIHVFYGLAFDMTENREIFIFVFRIINMRCKLFTANCNILHTESAFVICISISKRLKLQA